MLTEEQSLETNPSAVELQICHLIGGEHLHGVAREGDVGQPLQVHGQSVDVDEQPPEDGGDHGGDGHYQLTHL